MSSYKIFYFHGLFGENQKINTSHDITYVDTYKVENINELDINNKSILIGYSLGGRVLLSLLDKINFNVDCKSINLLSTHLGLNKKNIRERQQFEEEMLKNFSKNKINDYWNKLNIFENDKNIIIDTEKIELYKSIFNKYRLSNQKNYTKTLEKENTMFKFHLGIHDKKYCQYYEQNKLKNLYYYPTSHRGVLDYFDKIIGETYG